MKKLLFTLTFMCVGMLAYSQTIKATLVDHNTNEPLVGATVYVQDLNIGTITDIDGSFELTGVPEGSMVEVTYIGYRDKNIIVGPDGDMGTISLTAAGVGLQEVLVVADVAIDRKTPVAVTTLKGEVIEAKIGNQEFPEILRKTPSIYVTKQGGGFGDARMNIRGFNQRNFAVMINGIPVNDMENGWVYWSNWAGLSDVTSRVQYQRGLTATKLAVPTIGGSVNIITNPADFETGGTAGVTIGNDGYLKGSVSYNTGMSEKGWAATFQLAHTRGDGYVNFTKFRANSIFAAVSKQMGSNHMLSLTALSAPQWHHQRTGASRFDRMNLRTFNDPDNTGEAGTNLGIKYNQVGGFLNGEEFTWRKNFYAKPKVFLNHYWTINENLDLKTSVYYSQGRGGGTGPRGRINGADEGTYFRGRVFDSFTGLGLGVHNAEGEVRFDDIVAYNQGTSFPTFGEPNAANGTTTSSGDGFIRRASMNSHNWFGALSTLTAKVSENLDLTAGVDVRSYEGIHYRRLENLLGNNSYVSRSDDNNDMRSLSVESPADFGNFSDNSYQDKSNVLNYWNDGLVRWLGFFGQLEYSNDAISAFASASFSNQGFKRIDYFNYLDNDPARETDWENHTGNTFKAGVNYNINKNHNIFLNGGVLSKQPIFDNVFINFRNDVNPDIENQNVTSLEFGYGYRSSNFNFDLNLYTTEWTDRQFDVGIELADDQEGLALFRGVGQTHSGLEIEADYAVNRSLDFYTSVTLGNWKYSSDFTASITNTDTNQPAGDLTIFADGLPIGDAAQTKFTLGLNYEIIDGLRFYGDYTFFDRLYAQYDIDDSQFQAEGGEIAQLPSYSLVDAGLTYSLPIDGLRSSLRLNINNVLDAQYISESFTNIKDDPATSNINEIYNNRGFWGFGRTWNIGYKVWF